MSGSRVVVLAELSPDCVVALLLMFQAYECAAELVLVVDDLRQRIRLAVYVGRLRRRYPDAFYEVSYSQEIRGHFDAAYHMVPGKIHATRAEWTYAMTEPTVDEARDVDRLVVVDAAALTGNMEVSLADGADPDVAEFASGRFVMRACLFFVDLGEDDVATRAAEAAAAVLMVV